MENRKASGYVSPTDLGDLQVTFDALLAKHGLHRGSPRVDQLAKTLLMAHSSGVVGHDELIRYAEIAGGLGLSP